MDALNFLDIREYKREIDLIAEQLDVSNKTFLVTGANGLIGSVIVDALIEGNRRHKLDNTIIATGRNADKLEVRFPYTDEDFKLLVYDVNNSINDSLKIDYIIHTASNADPKSYASKPTETLLTNIIGTKNILDYCKFHINCRCLLMSTFEVYGKIEGKREYNEEDVGTLDFNRLRSCYPESKRAMEIMAHCYHEEYGVDYVVGRLCSIYGPTMSPKDSKAHAQFFRKALAHEDIVLKSKGEQVRSYCYVMDAASALLKILLSGKSGECYNVSNEKAITSIYNLAHLIANKCNLNVVQELPTELETKGYSRPQDIILDNKKLRSLNWNAIYNLDDGINYTLSIIHYLNNSKQQTKSKI